MFLARRCSAWILVSWVRRGCSAVDRFIVYQNSRSRRCCNIYLSHTRGRGQTAVLEIHGCGQRDVGVRCMDVLQKCSVKGIGEGLYWMWDMANFRSLESGTLIRMGG